jgi:beta-glucanase (GH16 family)
LFEITVRGEVANPGFETGSFDNWQTFGSNVAVAPITPHNGSYVAAISGENSGADNYSGFFQNVPTSEGVDWVALAWVRHNTNTALTGTANQCLLKIEFYRVANGAYGTSDMLSEHSKLILDGTTGVDSWAEHMLPAAAPVDAVEARVTIVFVQQNDDPGAVVVDDLSMATNTPPDQSWDLIWGDEFDEATVDATKWRVEDIHQIKNNELQYYAPDDVYQTTVDGRSVLTLRSQQRVISGFDNQGGFGTWNYSSGLVDTKERFATVYGRIEIGAQLPSDKGMWPAHWGLASDGGWPPEIDIMEAIGQIPNVVHMSHHWGPLGPNWEPPWEIGQTVTGTFNGPDFTAGFHEFAIEWQPGQIDWFIDGILRQSSTNANVPNVPFHWIFNTAVGGDWPGPPDGSTTFPQHHYIDYVRVYVPSDPGPALIDLVDSTRTAGEVDGFISAGEYPSSASGVNTGAGDIIGASSSMHFDTDSEGNLLLGFDNAASWPTTPSRGVIVYVDSIAGGYASTYELKDQSDPSRRLISGKASSGQRGDLFFPFGVRADYAICAFPTLVGVYRIDKAGHEFIQGAFLNSATDIFGGNEVSYIGSSGERELRIKLSHLAAAPLDVLRIFANVFDANTGERFNEFVGASAGNPWDGGNIPAGTSTVMKPGDFLCLQAAPGFYDADGDGDVDDIDFAMLAECFAGPMDPPSQGGGLTAAECLLIFDIEADGHIDLQEFKEFQLRFGGAESS